MLSRVFAVWLVSLILLPFTPPFSTCDASSLFPSDEQSDETSAAYSPLGSLTDTATAHALPVGRIGGRGKSVVVAAREPAGLVFQQARHRTPGHAMTRTFVSTPLAAPLRI
jgi:hypothetical protein